MCGRYVSASSPNEIADYFDAVQVDESLSEPNYNVAPTTRVPVVTVQQDQRRLSLYRWGLIPFWAKSASIGAKMTNARVETVVEKSSFGSSVTKRRCLIPADAFYEWTVAPKADGKGTYKQPWCIMRSDGAPFAFAGIYSFWRDPETAELSGDDSTELTASCSILTTAANQTMASVHDRMPVMVPVERFGDWLDPDNHEPQPLLDSLPPWPDEDLLVYPVRTDVNNSRSTGAELMEPAEYQAPLL